MESTCLMLMTSLYTAVDLEYVIDPADLAEGGIENDSHITILYTPGRPFEHGETLGKVKDYLGVPGWSKLEELFQDRSLRPVLDDFGLDLFECPDYDVLVLRLRESAPMIRELRELNSRFLGEPGIEDGEYDYNPHLTLAYLKPGAGEKYLISDTLGQVLADSRVTYDDLMYSRGTKGDYRQWYLTQYNCIERHLRLERMMKMRQAEA